MNYHTSTPRNKPERYIEVTKEPHPTKGAGWWTNVSMTIHDGDKPMVYVPMDGAMKSEGVTSKAEELARSKGIQDVFDFPLHKSR